MNERLEKPKTETGGEKSKEGAARELDAFEILKEYRVLSSEARQEFVRKAERAGFDFEEIISWESRNPELSIGQLLERAGIDPEKKFKLESQ